VQETFLEDPIFGRLREGPRRVPEMRQQESRAALVRLYRHHVEKERVMLGVTYALRQVFLRFHPIDGITRDYDVVIDGGEIRKRKKKPSKQFRDEFGHTPYPSKRT
jgi:hypothetical protein